jgi:hypothetical protein
MPKTNKNIMGKNDNRHIINTLILKLYLMLNTKPWLCSKAMGWLYDEIFDERFFSIENNIHMLDKLCENDFKNIILLSFAE